MGIPHVRTHDFRAPSRRVELTRALRTTERTLREHGDRVGLHPLALREGLARAFGAAVVDALCAAPEEPVHLGLQGGERLVVGLGGVSVAFVAEDPACLSPHAVTLLHRVDGVVHVAHDVDFGDPQRLREVEGLPPGCVLNAVEAVVRGLGREVEPVAPIGAVHLPDEAGWEVFRFLEVRARVVDPRLHLGVEEARRLEPDSRAGDLVGVSLPSQDWLTPILCWMAGGG